MELVDRSDGLESDRRVPVQGYRLAVRLCRAVPGFLAEVGGSATGYALNRQKARALAKGPPIRGREEIDQDLRLVSMDGLLRDRSRIHRRKVASPRQRARELDAFGGDDLGCLRATDWAFRIAFGHVAHCGRAVRINLQAACDFVGNAELP